jgi:hypothetical protein
MLGQFLGKAGHVQFLDVPHGHNRLVTETKRNLQSDNLVNVRNGEEDEKMNLVSTFACAFYLRLTPFLLSLPPPPTRRLNDRKMNWIPRALRGSNWKNCMTTVSKH